MHRSYYCPICHKLIENHYSSCDANDHKLNYYERSDILLIHLKSNSLNLILYFYLSKIELTNNKKLILETNDISVIKDLSIQELNKTANRLLMLSRLQ
jgi:hypothetical protein